MNWTEVKEGDTKLSKRCESAAASNLTYNRCLDQKKGRLVDSSIHMTNIHHIRRAKHFIYIESQYFMGSSFMWSNDNNAKCGNLIAAEVRNTFVLECCVIEDRSEPTHLRFHHQIALKICEKIAADEPFAVYILLPMWMEGIPGAHATQGLLYNQRKTIEAMYQMVEDALEAKMANTSAHGLKVSDYLNIYCLGNRETADGNEATGTPQTDDEILLAKTRRHQIYIHSKFMIVVSALSNFSSQFNAVTHLTYLMQLCIFSYTG